MSLVNIDGNRRHLRHHVDEINSSTYLHAVHDVAQTRHEMNMKLRQEQKALEYKEKVREKEELKLFTPITEKDRKEIRAQLSGGTIANESTTGGSRMNKQVVLSTEEAVSASYKYPFSLVHLHREKMKYRAGTGPRRLVKCFFRLCGTMQNCADAVKAAEAIMLSAFISMFNSKMERSSEVLRRI